MLIPDWFGRMEEVVIGLVGVSLTIVFDFWGLKSVLMAGFW